MTQLLISLAPLIINLGLKLIDWFVKDTTSKDQLKLSFLSLIQAHAADAQKSVEANKSYKEQVEQLRGTNANSNKANE